MPSRRALAALVVLFVALVAGTAVSAPAARAVTREGPVEPAAARPLWPSNPWDHGPMQQRADRGSFGYVRSADGKTFTLNLHQALKEDYVLQGTPAQSTAGDRP